MYSSCFALLHKTCGMILTCADDTQNLWNFVTFEQKMLKSFFCVLKKTQKHVIVCIDIVLQQNNNRRKTEWFHRMHCVILWFMPIVNSMR